MAGQGCAQLVVRAKGFNTTPEIPSSLLSGSGFQFAIWGVFGGKNSSWGGVNSRESWGVGGGGGSKDRSEWIRGGKIGDLTTVKHRHG